jgi:hypothetical protein
MAQIAWLDFLNAHSSAHLVVARVLPTRAPSHLAQLRRTLNKLIEQGQPAGDFATAIVRPGGVTEIHCAFAHKADADRLARLAGARRAGAPDEWASHRAFTLDAPREVALAGSLSGDKPAPPRGRSFP